MTSLALLAHATRAAAPPFNATYYATIATVIPVLVLGFIVQGGGYNELLAAIRNTQGPYGLDLLLTYGAWYVLAFGLFGETFALNALAHESESVFPGLRLAVGLTTGLLLAAVTALPLVRFVSTSRIEVISVKFIALA